MARRAVVPNWATWRPAQLNGKVCYGPPLAMIGQLVIDFNLIENGACLVMTKWSDAKERFSQQDSELTSLLCFRVESVPTGRLWLGVRGGVFPSHLGRHFNQCGHRKSG
jgi:hypothetical protein